jgi:hypothetical protein
MHPKDQIIHNLKTLISVIGLNHTAEQAKQEIKYVDKVNQIDVCT